MVSSIEELKETNNANINFKGFKASLLLNIIFEVNGIRFHQKLALLFAVEKPNKYNLQ